MHKIPQVLHQFLIFFKLSASGGEWAADGFL